MSTLFSEAAPSWTTSCEAFLQRKNWRKLCGGNELLFHCSHRHASYARRNSYVIPQGVFSYTGSRTAVAPSLNRQSITATSNQGVHICYNAPTVLRSELRFASVHEPSGVL
jgi:hypothetical protein